MTIQFATKMVAPRLAPDLVARPALNAKLEAGLAGKVTLVCAPAGFGKTTAVAAWLHGRGAGRDATPAAWYTVDKADDDLVVFLGYVVAAVRTVYPGAMATTAGLLLAAYRPPLEYLADAVLADLAEVAGGVILVLDDYHTVAAAEIHTVVGRVARRLPEGVHLVVATRSEVGLPTARLRAARQLTVVGPADLCLTRAEADGLIARVAPTCKA